MRRAQDEHPPSAPGREAAPGPCRAARKEAPLAREGERRKSASDSRAAETSRSARASSTVHARAAVSACTIVRVQRTMSGQVDGRGALALAADAGCDRPWRRGGAEDGTGSNRTGRRRRSAGACPLLLRRADPKPHAGRRRPAAGFALTGLQHVTGVAPSAPHVATDDHAR